MQSRGERDSRIKKKEKGKRRKGGREDALKRKRTWKEGVLFVLNMHVSRVARRGWKSAPISSCKIESRIRAANSGDTRECDGGGDARVSLEIDIVWPSSSIVNSSVSNTFPGETVLSLSFFFFDRNVSHFSSFTWYGKKVKRWNV